jgi:type VI secretion system protein ImpH
MAAAGGASDFDVAAPGPPVEAETARAPARSRYSAVAKLLRETPQEFEFFQAVRLLERVLPERAPVGRFVSPAREVVRFSAHASFPFPASQIQEIQWLAEAASESTAEPARGAADETRVTDTRALPTRSFAAPRMIINFMGLTGPSGVLPLYYTELIVERLRHRDRAMLNFFDIFNHRMVSLFYQAWEKYRFTIAYERGERDRFSHHLADLIGIGTKGLEQRLAVRDDSLLFYAGLLSMHARSAAALERILSDYFDIPVEVEQFVGAWQRLGSSDLCRFDRGASLSEQLGGGAVVGDEIWNQQSGVRIKLGPLTLAQYLDFLPSGTAYEPLWSLARFATRGEIDFEVQLILRKEDVPACELGTGAMPPLLGWTSWAKTQPLASDACDTILRMETISRV